MFGVLGGSNGHTCVSSLSILYKSLRHVVSVNRFSVSLHSHISFSLFYFLRITRTCTPDQQIAEVTSSACAAVQLRSAVVYGGVDYRTQVQTVRGGQHVLVATPGRLMGMMREQVCERERGGIAR